MVHLMSNSPWSNFPKDTDINKTPKIIPDSEKSYTFIFHSEDELVKFKNLYCSLILEFVSNYAQSFAAVEKCIMSYKKSMDHLMIDDTVESGYFRLSKDGNTGIGWKEYAFPESQEISAENKEKYKSSISQLLNLFDNYKS
jgi:hypothetical protein